MEVKFLDLKKINGRFEREFKQVLQTVLESGYYIGSSQNQNFCKNFANYCGVDYCLGVANGLDALKIILKAAGIGPGDEVIVPSNTFIATILSISEVGAQPILVEPELDGFNLDPENIETHINEKTKAIIAVHLYGKIAQMQKISKIAEKHGIYLFEDAAQAHGAELNGKKVGSWGHAAAFSFYPGKNLGCLGDGGAITTKDKDFYVKCKALSNYGSDVKYHHIYKGYNSRLDELQASFLNIKLPYLEADNSRRQDIARKYVTEIRNEELGLPDFPEDPRENVWHVFPILSEDRKGLISYLKEKGVETLIHYPTPPHKQDAYKEFYNQSLPRSEYIHEHILSLPISPVMTDEEVDYVIKALNNWKK